MRKIDPWFLTNPAFDEWRHKAETARGALIDSVVDNGLDPKDCFNAEIWGEFKRQVLMGGGDEWKCMYCEGIYDAGGYGDAEHYRPKGAVTSGRKDESHPGYWWLAYEWQNLLLACRYCNSIHPNANEPTGKHPGKLNEFPVSGIRSTVPNFRGANGHQIDFDAHIRDLLREDPQLLHPYFDRAEDHFKAASHGVIEGTTDRGKVTIEVCDLNRPRLTAARENAEKAAIVKLTEGSLGFSKGHLPADVWFCDNEAFSMYLNSWLLNFLESCNSVRSRPR